MSRSNSVHTSIDQLQSMLAGQRVGIIGDVMVDRYVYGAVDRISPEAPVPVLRFHREEMRLGGAANVALNVLGLGSTPVIASIIGTDEGGDFICQHLEELSTISDYLTRSTSRPTTVKSRYIGNHQHIMRMDQESTEDLTNDEESGLMQRVTNMLEHESLDVLILQDYNKGTLNEVRIRQIIDQAHAHGIPVVVDPKFDHFLAYGGADLFKPNLKELSEGLGRPVEPSLASLDDAVLSLRNQMDIRHCMVTLGAYGIYFSSPDQPSILVPATTSEVVDVCGAGDAVIATAALLFHAALGDEMRGIVCNAVGSVVCGYRGVSAIQWPEVAAQLEAIIDG